MVGTPLNDLEPEGQNPLGVQPGTPEDNLRALIGGLDTLAQLVLHADKLEKRRPTQHAVVDACRVVCSLVPMMIEENQTAWQGIMVLRAKINEMQEAPHPKVEGSRLWTPE